MGRRQGDGLDDPRQPRHEPPVDGFQTHQIVERWGERNLFQANTIAGTGLGGEEGKPGYGIALRPVDANMVRCDNTVSGGIALTNTGCG